MKSRIIIGLILMISISLSARGYYQKVTAADLAFDILTLVTSTQTSYTSPNYRITAFLSQHPEQLLQTGIDPTSVIRLYKMGTGVSIPYFAAVFVDLEAFPTPWIAGEMLNITVTKTDAFPIQTMSWEFVIPIGTSVIYIPDQAQFVPPAPPIVEGYDVTITSNIPGTLIFKDGQYTGTAPHTFTDLTGSHLWGVMDISTQVKPEDRVIEESGTYSFDYTNPTNTSGGGEEGGSTILSMIGDFTVPPINGVSVSGIAGGTGLLVVTKKTPPGGTYLGCNHVSVIYQVWVSNPAILNRESLSFDYTPTTPNMVAFHWGTLWPLDFPNPNFPALGYSFNGAIDYMFFLGMGLSGATFSASTYINNVLITAPLPIYDVTTPGTFEVILNDGLPVPPVVLSSFATVATTNLNVNLLWTTESEFYNVGCHIFRSTDSDISHATQINDNMIHGNLGSGQTNNYSYFDNAVESGFTYYYWLRFLTTLETYIYSDSCVVTTLVLPAEITQFSGVYNIEQQRIKLQWTTASENNVLGFNIFRGYFDDFQNATQLNQAIIPGTNTSAVQNYEFYDTDVVQNMTYTYWVQTVDLSGLGFLFQPSLEISAYSYQVEISSFTATWTQQGINIQWTTEFEANLQGFDLFRSNTPYFDDEIQVNADMIAATNEATQHYYNFIDTSADNGYDNYYQIKLIGMDGSFSYSNFVYVSPSANGDQTQPSSISTLGNAYPNPFRENASTNIEVNIKKSETATLSIFNIRGQRVKTYALNQDSHCIQWDGNDNYGRAVGSGVYFYKLDTQTVSLTKKMVILK
jgi:hypothetical protein